MVYTRTLNVALPIRKHMWGEVSSPLVHDQCPHNPQLAFDIIENGRSWLFSTKMGVVWPLIIDQRLIHLTPHMFPCHRSHSWISGGEHFLVKNPYVLAFGIIENGHSWLFSTQIGAALPLTVDQMLIHLTPHMFPCHRSHSWIYGGDHFLVKNSYVLAFGIIENGRSWLFSAKWWLCGH